MGRQLSDAAGGEVEELAKAILNMAREFCESRGMPADAAIAAIATALCIHGKVRGLHIGDVEVWVSIMWSKVAIQGAPETYQTPTKGGA